MKTQFIQNPHEDIMLVHLGASEGFVALDSHQRIREVDQIVLHFADGTFALQGQVIHGIGNHRIIGTKYTQNDLQVLPARVREEVAVAFLVYELEATPADELIAKMLAESIAKLTA